MLEPTLSCEEKWSYTFFHLFSNACDFNMFKHKITTVVKNLHPLIVGTNVIVI